MVCLIDNLIRTDIPLYDKCSYRTGGQARFYTAPRNINELKIVLQWSQDNSIPFFIIGRGTNLLISDEGFDGLIINLVDYNRFILKKNNSIYCGAGIKLDDLIMFSISRSLSGLESLSGIPGTVGGGIVMNAGAFGSEIKDCLILITAIDKSGKEYFFKPEDIKFSYRSASGLSGFIVTGAKFLLNKSDKETIKNVRETVLKKRREKQPLDKPSCGSVFKRPIVNYAGALIEKCGLKGLRRGKAVISEKHANFILNDGGATSEDIKWLIDKARTCVLENTGIELFPEVCFVGFQ